MWFRLPYSDVPLEVGLSACFDVWFDCCLKDVISPVSPVLKSKSIRKGQRGQFFLGEIILNPDLINTAPPLLWWHVTLQLTVSTLNLHRNVSNTNTDQAILILRWNSSIYLHNHNIMLTCDKMIPSSVNIANKSLHPDMVLKEKNEKGHCWSRSRFPITSD